MGDPRLPDDWASYNRTCPQGHRYHLSEGGCGDCEADYEDAVDEAAADPQAYCDAQRGCDDCVLNECPE